MTKLSAMEESNDMRDDSTMVKEHDGWVKQGNQGTRYSSGYRRTELSLCQVYASPHLLDLHVGVHA